MAIVTNTFTALDLVGGREDLDNELQLAGYADDFFSSELKEGKPKTKNFKVEWLTESIRASADNAHIQADTESPTARTAASRVYNQCQIFKEIFSIGNTEKVMDGAANVESIEHHTMLAMKGLAKDIERAYLNGTRQDPVKNTTEGKLRGLLNWITTNLSRAGDSTLNADGTVTGGTARDLTNSLVADVLQDVFVSGGSNITEAMCNAFQKRKFSTFKQYENYRQAVEKGRLDTVVDIYVGDWHTFKIRTNREMPTDQVAFCDKRTWKKATLRPTSREKMPTTGDYEWYSIRTERSLKAMNETANGRITNLTTS